MSASHPDGRPSRVRALDRSTHRLANLAIVWSLLEMFLSDVVCVDENGPRSSVLVRVRRLSRCRSLRSFRTFVSRCRAIQLDEKQAFDYAWSADGSPARFFLQLLCLSCLVVMVLLGLGLWELLLVVQEVSR